MSNPLLPGYFADPTIKKFGDTFYIYATTDGNGGGFGPSQVWTSKDFVNWSLQDMNWPTTHHYWAPDVTQTTDGKYYMYYCQPVEIFGATSDSPVGPWTPLLPPGEPVVKNYLVPNVITLDGQTFRDDDGKMYLFWGTWGIYPKHGCGVGLFNPDMKSFSKLGIIPNTDAKDFFEAPFLFKRNGIYYLTYSSGRCEDDTYRVQYAVSKTGPMGPYVYGKNNPILSTSADGTVHGPGHQSVLQNGKEYYLIYHRHNNPHSGGGYHRQVAADRLVFDSEGNIEKLAPSHTGIGFLGKDMNPYPDLMFGASVTASSYYDDDFKPEFAVDHNNGTLWKPRSNTAESWLIVDLKASKQIESIHTQFEYATWYYQYLIETSDDKTTWAMYADRSKNTVHGSPMIDLGNVKARYIRISVLNTEYPGLNKAIWNIKAFANDSYQPKDAIKAKPESELTKLKPLGLLVDLNAADLEIGEPVNSWSNKGKLGGKFSSAAGASPVVEMLAGRKAISFSGKSSMMADVQAPGSLLGNSSFTVSAWLYNPVIEEDEPYLSWTTRGGVDISNASMGYGSDKKSGAAEHWGWPDMAYAKLPEAGKWHHVALVFDGTYERLYVDGKLDHQELKMLFIANLTNFVLGSNGDRSAYFTGGMASLKIYDTALDLADVLALAADTGKSNIAVYLDAAKLPYGSLAEWKNEGYLQDQVSFEPGQLKADDLYGKIAVVSDSLPAKLKHAIKTANLPSYTLVAVLAGPMFGDQNWHHIARTKQGAEELLYVDGLLNVKKSLAGLLAANEPKSWSLKGISAMVMYDESLPASKVAELFKTWKATLPGLMQQPQFAKAPQAFSPTQVGLSASAVQLPGKILQYQFYAATDKGEVSSSDWMDSREYVDHGVSANLNYTFSYKVRDNYGNVSAESPPFKVSTAESLFSIFRPDFSKDHDLRKTLVGTQWDGLMGVSDTARVKDGNVLLSSTDTKWDGHSPNGPFLYKTVRGDFIAEAEIADVSGMQKKIASGANDAGLMAKAAGLGNALVQNSIFPGWGVGNVVTDLSDKGRLQSFNSSAWNFYRHLQIQRMGNTFFMRGSTDGKLWRDLPGSPLRRPDFESKAMEVGLFQATYGIQHGYGSFRNFVIYQRKLK
ncbi:family 43 glycosylhydrolase [Pedobacter sp. PWIIR3]